jgi:hypothetical protein
LKQVVASYREFVGWALSIGSQEKWSGLERARGKKRESEVLEEGAYARTKKN